MLPVFVEQWCQVTPGIRLRAGRYIFGRAGRHDRAAAIAALRPQIDHPVSCFNHRRQGFAGAKIRRKAASDISPPVLGDVKRLKDSSNLILLKQYVNLIEFSDFLFGAWQFCTWMYTVRIAQDVRERTLTFRKELS